MREPEFGAKIFSKPATKTDIRYLRANPGLWPEEREVRIDWEGRDIGVFAHIRDIDLEKETLSVWVWDIGRAAILFELPGDDVNATGRRLWASRKWLDDVKVS